MTTLIKDPVSGGFKLPDDPTNKFNTATGQLNPKYVGATPSYSGLAPGVTPSYNSQNSGVTFNIPDKVGGQTTSSIQTPSSTVNFTTALIQMLKEAQGRDATGQASLMKQSQGIIGQGLNDATRNFNNPLLAPNSGTSLGLSAQNQFDPLTLSIANQQKLATQNLGNITDVLKQTSTDYQNEQDRLSKEREDALNRAASAGNPYTNYSAKQAVAQSIDQKKIALYFSKAGKEKRDAQGYITPEEYRNAKAQWIIDGYAGNDFDAIFNGVINPANAQEYGVGFQTKVSSNSGISPEMEALLNSLK